MRSGVRRAPRSSTAQRLPSAGVRGRGAVGSGAGIGHVGPYNEMGNFYRGGAVHLELGLGRWYDIIASGNPARPMFPGALRATT